MLIHHKTEVAGHFHECAQLLSLNNPHQLLPKQVVVHPVADAELDLRSRTSLDHALAVCDGCGHWLFRDNVFACLRSSYGELRMQRWRCHDINYVNVAVVRDAIEVFVT